MLTRRQRRSYQKMQGILKFKQEIKYGSIPKSGDTSTGFQQYLEFNNIISRDGKEYHKKHCETLLKSHETWYTEKEFKIKETLRSRNFTETEIELRINDWYENIRLWPRSADVKYKDILQEAENTIQLAETV